VGSDVGQPQRPGVVDQQAEQATALGPVVDPRDLVLAQADRDELGQPQLPAVVIADDARIRSLVASTTCSRLCSSASNSSICRLGRNSGRLRVPP
jgi:hypothetical protein